MIGADEPVTESAFVEIGPRVLSVDEAKRVRDAEEERDDLRHWLDYAEGLISGLCGKLRELKPPIETAAPRQD